MTTTTHPPDPVDPKRFRRNGGGVLQCTEHNLDIISTEIQIKCKAELLSIELTDKSGCKTILSTFYRVGTLGLRNRESIMKSIKSFCKVRNPRKYLLLATLV